MPAPDPLAAFRTHLSHRDELNFQMWLMKQSFRAQRDYSRGLRDYDLRGLWRETKGADLGPGHSTDRYKRPNHPTFSTDSIYSGLPGGPVGGRWTGDDKNGWAFQASPANFIHQTPQQLQQYFRIVEPKNHLILPEAVR